MDQRGNSLIYILIGLISLFVLSGGFYFYNKSLQTQQTVPQSLPSLNNSSSTPIAIVSPTFIPSQIPLKYIPHLAGDPTISLQHIKILTVILKPSDINLSSGLNWQTLMNNWYKDVVNYWADVFGDKSIINYETYPSIVDGNSTALSYDFSKAYTEVSDKLKNQEDLVSDFSNNSPEYLLLMIYVLNDDSHPGLITKGSATHSGRIGTSVIPLDNGLVVIGAPNPNPNVSGAPVPAEEVHEIGHALGLKHSSDYPEIVTKYFVGNKWNSSCDLMIAPPYDKYFQRKFVPNRPLKDNYCLLPEQKDMFFN